MSAGQLSNVVRHIRRLLGGPGGKDCSDRELLGRFAAGRDEEAFAALVRRHGPLVLGVCRRVLGNHHDADDAFQAVFLVLARKAGEVSWRESVANWLYEVAHRTANQLRIRRTVRDRHEQEAGAMHASRSPSEAGWHELRQVLDDELMHLPEKYRMPLLLCYLHGKTRDEAAAELGWSLNVLKGTLERGKEYLRQRLARRGLTFSAALLATELSANAVSAVPASLVTTTTTAATAGAVSAPVAALMEGAIQAMFWTKVKTAMLLLSAFSLIGLMVVGGGLFVFQARGEKDSSAGTGRAPTPMANLPQLPVVAQPPNRPAGEADADLLGLPAAIQGRTLEEQAALLKKMAAKYRPKEGVKVFQTPDLQIEMAVAADNTSIRNYRPTAKQLTVLVAGDGVNPYAGRLLVPAGAPSSVSGGSVHLAAMPPSGRVYALSGDGSRPGLNAGGGGCGVVTAGEKPCYDGPFRHFCAQDPNKVGSGRGFLVIFDCNPIEPAAAQAKPSEPLVQDGLAVTVTPSKKVFPLDEKPSFQIGYENRTGKAIQLLDLGYEVGYLKFTSVADGKVDWQAFPRGHLYNERRPPVPPNSEPGLRKAREPVSATIEPGKRAVSEVVVAGEFARPSEAGVQIRETLPPGKYLLRANIEFRAGKDNNDPPYWVGKMTTNPVEFEIAAPAQAQSKADLIKQLDLKWQVCVRRYRDLNRQVTVLMLRLDRSQQKEDKQAAEILKRLLEWQVAGEEGALYEADAKFAARTLQEIKALMELNDRMVDALPKVQAAYRKGKSAFKATDELEETLNVIDKALDGLLKDRIEIKDGLARLQKEMEKELLP